MNRKYVIAAIVNTTPLVVQLVRDATEGKIVLGLSGNVYSNKKHTEEEIISAYRRYLRRWIGVFIFGVEDDFQHALCESLMGFGCIACGIRKELYKLQLPLLMKRSSILKRLWPVISTKPGYSPETEEFVKRLNLFFRESEGRSVDNFMWGFNIALKNDIVFSSDVPYVELYREIARTLYTEGGEEYGLRPYVDGIEKFLKDPYNVDHQSFVVNEVVSEWASDFIGENVKRIIDYAKKPNKDVYILVGGTLAYECSSNKPRQRWCRGLRDLPEVYKGYRKEMYPNPEEFMRGTGYKLDALT